LVISSCSNTRYLKEGEVLYHKTSVELRSEENIRKEADLLQELEEQTYPRLNRKFLKLFKLKLFIYNYLKDEPGADRLLFENSGEPPVLYDTLSLEKSVQQLKSHLVSKGFFNHEVDYDVKIKDKRASVVYKIDVGI